MNKRPKEELTTMQANLIRLLHDMGLSKETVMAVMTVVQSDESIWELLDRMHSLDKSGTKVQDKQMTEILLDMIGAKYI